MGDEIVPVLQRQGSGVPFTKFPASIPAVPERSPNPCEVRAWAPPSRAFIKSQLPRIRLPTSGTVFPLGARRRQVKVISAPAPFRAGLRSGGDAAHRRRCWKTRHPPCAWSTSPRRSVQHCVDLCEKPRDRAGDQHHRGAPGVSRVAPYPAFPPCRPPPRVPYDTPMAGARAACLGMSGRATDAYDLTACRGDRARIKNGGGTKGVGGVPAVFVMRTIP